MKLWIDYSDGRFSFREPPEGCDPIDVSEISDEQFALWEEAMRLDGIMQRQMRDLSNEVYRKREELQASCNHPEWFMYDHISNYEYCKVCKDCRKKET